LAATPEVLGQVRRRAGSCRFPSGRAQHLGYRGRLSNRGKKVEMGFEPSPALLRLTVTQASRRPSPVPPDSPRPSVSENPASPGGVFLLGGAQRRKRNWHPDLGVGERPCFKAT